MNLKAKKCKWFILDPKSLIVSCDGGICDNPETKSFTCWFSMHLICDNYKPANGYWGPKQEDLIKRSEEIKDLENLYNKESLPDSNPA